MEWTIARIISHRQSLCRLIWHNRTSKVY